jgi:hypothetical protein
MTTKTGSKKVFVDRDTWRSLSQADRTAWDKLTDGAKTKIVGYGIKKGKRLATESQSTEKRSVHFHDVEFDDDAADSDKEPAALEVGTHEVQSEIARSRKYKKKTSSDDGGRSTASDKSSDDLFSLMTARNTSSDLKKRGIDVDKVISERMAAAHISREFTPEAFHLEFEATMEEEEDAGTPTLEGDTPTIEYEGELEESTLEVNMHHFYRGDPDEIREFALQDAVPYESSEGGTSSGNDSTLHELEQLLEGDEDVSREHLQRLAYQGDSPESKTDEGMDEMLAVLQASSSDETAERAAERMERPFQHVERPQVRTIDRIVPNEDRSNHVLITEAEYHRRNSADNASTVRTIEENDLYVPSGMFDREPAVYSSTSESHSHPSGRESSRLNAATSGERVATQPINRGSPTTPVHDTHVRSYPDDVQVTGPDVDWNRIVAEAMQVLRENPSMFDITQAYDYTAMNQDDTTGNDMTDMERQIREDESDTETDGDVPGLEEVPEDGDLPVLLPRNRINSSDSESIGNEDHDDESTDSGVPELVPRSGSPLRRSDTPMEIFWRFRRDFQRAVEESKQGSKNNDTIYQNCGSDIPSMLEVNRANLSGPDREQTATGPNDQTTDAENTIRGNHEFLDPQNQTNTPRARRPSVTGNEGLPVREDNIRIPEDVRRLEQEHSMRYWRPREEEVMQALQQFEEMTIADSASEEDDPMTSTLQLLGLTTETANLVGMAISDNHETRGDEHVDTVETQADEHIDTVESPVDVDLAGSEQVQTTATHPTDQPGNRRRTTADREVASTLTSPGDQQMLTRAQRMEREARAERARLAERQRLEQQIRKKARKAEKRRRKKDRKRRRQIEEIRDRDNPTLGDRIQGLVEIMAPSPTNQGTQEESQSSPSSGSNTANSPSSGSNTTGNSSNDGSPGSSEGNDNNGTQPLESHDSHEPESNPDSNSGPMDGNQDEAPNESEQDFGQAEQH